MKVIDQLKLQFKVKNTKRKWYQIWKPCYIKKETTLYGADIKVSDEELASNGTFSYTLNVPTKKLREKIKEAVEKSA